VSRARRLLFVSWAAVALAPSAALAQTESDPALTLAVDGPAWLHECLAQAKLQASIEARAAALPPPLWVRASADAAQGAQPTQLTIQVADAGGELGTRSIEVQPGDCAALADAVAIVVLLLAQQPAGDPASSAPAGRGAPPAAPGPPAVPPPVGAPAVRPPPDSTEVDPERRAALSSGMELMFDVLPNPGLGLFVEGALIVGAQAAVAVRLRSLLPQSRGIAEGSVQFAFYELSADFCVGSLDYDSTRIGLRLCLGPSAAITTANGSGFALQNRNEVDGMASLEGRAGMSLGLARSTWIRLEAGARLAALRPQFYVRLADGLAQRLVHAPGLLQTTVGLGLVQLF